jgi:hypothetical protein
MKTPDEISDQKVPRRNRVQGRKEIAAQDHARAAKEDAGGTAKEVRVGDYFGLLTVKRMTGKSLNGGTTWECQCECGTIRKFGAYQLLYGARKSCGCSAGKFIAQARYIHGGNRRGETTDEYKVWQGVKRRCYNPNERVFEYYGGRGIIMCERWKTSFGNFLADMGARPSIAHSIDRIDSNGNYEPSNCRWATRSEQSNNRRSNRRETFNGETRNVREWERHLGWPNGTINARLQNGHAIASAITMGYPAKKGPRRHD